MTQAEAAPEKKERWSFSWKHLYDEVVTSGLCTGCAGCVIACPHDVLGYDDTDGEYKPIQIEEYGGPGDCSHGDKAAPRAPAPARASARGSPRSTSSCSAASREPEEVSGIFKDIVPRPRRRPGARTRSARTAASSRRCSSTRSSTT